MTKTLFKFCKRYENELLWMAKNRKIFMSHVTTQQRIPTAEDILHNMFKMGIWGIPICLFDRALWSGHGGRDDSYLWTQQGPPLTKAITVSYYYCQGSNLPIAKPRHEPLIRYSSLGGLASHLLASWLYCIPFTLEEETIHPHWIRYVFGRWIFLF